ncbi:MAG TPA: GNAT family N-acetyltransferase [Acidiphilium sp.]
MSNPAWCIATARLRLEPAGWSDLADLVALKTDPRAFAMMLGGVRTPERAAEELAGEVAAWGANGYGIWVVRGLNTGNFVGITGLEARADGRGIALRFSLWPEMRGAGLAREAAGAALRYGHDRAGLGRIVAVARADNFASRTVLGAIGMVECEDFVRGEVPMLVYESVAGRGR